MIIPQQTPLFLPRLLPFLLRQPIHLLIMRSNRRSGATKSNKARSAIRICHRMVWCILTDRGSFRGIIFRAWGIGFGDVPLVVRTFSEISCYRFLSYRRSREVGGAEGRASNGAIAARLRLYGSWGSRHGRKFRCRFASAACDSQGIRKAQKRC